MAESADIKMVVKALISLYRCRRLHLRDNVIASKIFYIPNGKQLLIKKLSRVFQTQSSFIIKYLPFRLWFFELIFHLLWMDPLPPIFGWIQYWLCAPISYIICWVFTNGTKGQMCDPDGLFLGLRSLFRSLTGWFSYDQRWLEMVARFELLT